MAKYRKKPVIIDALQWTGKNQREMFDFLTDYGKSTESATLEGETFRIDLCNGSCRVGNLIIKTLEGEHIANVGDYVIKGIVGEFYPCRTDVFEHTYELVEGGK
jgi:hypothetical protein